ncbi:MAG: BACON domain-containing protein [Alistipes sp.]|nr:BACON domain-containing protein [Alistipes sp.]
MKNIFRSLLYSAMVLVAGFAASCTENEEGTGGYQGIPTIKVTPASLNVALAGGTTEQVVVETPAEWTLDIDTEGVIASAFSGNGDAVITFEVPAAEAMRTIKATFTATGYVSGYPITKKASVSISQSDSDIPSVDGEFVYYDNCGEAVSKVADKWPYVDAYTGWNPQGGEGFDQSGVTYTGKNASVRNSGESWTPVGATYATDAPYAYLQAKDGVEFIIHNIKIKSGVKNYTFSFTAHNQYANLIDSPYTPAPVSPLKSGENLTVEVSVDGTNFGAVTYSTMADGNWEYAIAPFTLPADADKLFVRFSNYKADTTTPLPSTAYQYQAALRFDDFRLVEGGNGPVVDFNNNIGGGGSTGGGDVPTEGVKATVAEFLAAAEDGTTYYDLTGVITNVANTTYGNFDLTDETGTVYIYGLCSPTGEQKYWAASGAKKGDTITVRTLRTSYNNTPQGKDAIFISLVPGEGGDEPTPEPAEGAYASDVPFVCAADDSDNCCYGHKDTNIGGSAVTGFKLGTGSKTGYFKSGAVGVDGDKYLNFYAVAWKGKSATLYMRVNGGETTSFELNAHVGATGNPPYLSLTAESSDHYSVKLDGLTTSSTIEFSTDASFSAVANDTSGRAIVFGMKLTDEPLGTDNPGGTTPEPEPDPTPGETKTIAQILAAGSGASLSGTIEGVVISNMDLNNLTSKKGLYIQDETGALQFYLAANHELAFGTKVRIDLTGTTLGDYNGAVQISGLALDKITTVSTGNTVEPKVVSIADFLANKYEGQYIAIEGVQVAAADLTKTWVMGGAHTSINVEDANGNKFVVFSSKYATYGAETVAQGSGTIKGIASINKGAMQIIFAQASDYASLTGARFDGTVTPEPDPTPSVKTATVAEFLAAAEDTTVYELTGVISNVTNTTYGNFDLTDQTGTVLIYGLCSPTGEQKYWAESGAKEGDTITVQTVRSSYNGTPQGKNAIFVKLVAGEGGTTDPTPDPEPTPGTPVSSISSDLNSSLTWTEETHATHGQGMYTMINGVKVGYYIGGNTSTFRTPDTDHIRIYQSAAFVITPVSGQKVTSVTMTTTGAKYAIDVPVTGAESAKGDGVDKITWTGSVAPFEVIPNAQFRIKNIAVTFE